MADTNQILLSQNSQKLHIQEKKKKKRIKKNYTVKKYRTMTKYM